jgi:hypothetical protein
MSNDTTPHPSSTPSLTAEPNEHPFCGTLRHQIDDFEAAQERLRLMVRMETLPMPVRAQAASAALHVGRAIDDLYGAIVEVKKHSAPKPTKEGAAR